MATTTKRPVGRPKTPKTEVKEEKSASEAEVCEMMGSLTKQMTRTYKSCLLYGTAIGRAAESWAALVKIVIFVGVICLGQILLALGWPVMSALLQLIPLIVGYKLVDKKATEIVREKIEEQNKQIDEAQVYMSKLWEEKK